MAPEQRHQKSEDPEIEVKSYSSCSQKSSDFWRSSQRNPVGSPNRCSLKKCISDKANFLRKFAPSEVAGPLLRETEIRSKAITKGNLVKSVIRRCCDDISCLQNLTSANESANASSLTRTRPFARSSFVKRCSLISAVLIQTRTGGISKGTDLHLFFKFKITLKTRNFGFKLGKWSRVRIFQAYYPVKNQ